MHGRKARQKRIALILPVDEYMLRLAEGAMEFAALHAEVTLVDVPYRLGVKDPIEGHLFDFDGAVVCLDPKDTWVMHLLDAGKTVVNTSGDWSADVIPKVVFGGPQLIQSGVDHLLGLGLPHAAYIGWQTSCYGPLLRAQSTLNERSRLQGVAFHSHETGGFPGAGDRMARIPTKVTAVLTKFLISLPKPAAVWCEDDLLARLVCDLSAQAGITVPGDLAVLGLGDRIEARMRRPTLSTIPLPLQLVGREALRLVFDRLCGKPLESRTIRIPAPPVLVRESTLLEITVETPLRLAYEWIGRRACEGITVNELLETVPMSPWTFSKRFAEVYGRTPGEEIRRVRLERSQHFLRTSQLSVERIAQLCGYDQQAKFSNFFKRETGLTPSEYRRGGG